MELLSPAKINLYLEITGKRPDGYHNLITLMYPIGLCDLVRLSFKTKKISVSCAHPEVPQDKTNLAFRAAQLFFDTHQIQEGLHIEIDKKIPVGAGLGGGSSNAAAVLKGLNTYYDSPFTNKELRSMGKILGADVPFFIFGGPAVATGIGDVLNKFNIPLSYEILLIYPSVNISTAEVYHNLNLTLTRNKKINNNNFFKSGWGQHAPKLLRNDLERAASFICPVVQAAKQALLKNGALGAMMSGSGSSVFGLFKNLYQAEAAYRIISSERPEWHLYVTNLITV